MAQTRTWSSTSMLLPQHLHWSQRLQGRHQGLELKSMALQLTSRSLSHNPVCSPHLCLYLVLSPSSHEPRHCCNLQHKRAPSLKLAPNNNPSPSLHSSKSVPPCDYMDCRELATSTVNSVAVNSGTKTRADGWCNCKVAR
mmetsp:Transcript_8912/g.24697  ORF Transcript_8912/g.24697 Transcript_8912/m.24697 type:complete len:140 (-) Transcript_8912:1926-2345(-)